MDWSLQLKVPPDKEIFTLGEAKKFLRVELSEGVIEITESPSVSGDVEVFVNDEEYEVNVNDDDTKKQVAQKISNSISSQKDLGDTTYEDNSVFIRGSVEVESLQVEPGGTGVQAKTEILFDEEQDLIQSYVSAVRMYCENYQRRAYITQEWRLVLDAFPRTNTIMLPRPPLQSVEEVAYKDKDGDLHVFDDYEVDKSSEPGCLFLPPGQRWPDVSLFPKAAVFIEFISGYGDPQDVPENIKQAIRLLCSQWYEYRETVVVGKAVNKIPFSSDVLLWQEKVATYCPEGG